MSAIARDLDLVKGIGEFRGARVGRLNVGAAFKGHLLAFFSGEVRSTYMQRILALFELHH